MGGRAMNSVRIRFTRGEEVKFISHLDLMKVFERAIRRSGLPIAYSQGFNPHPQMVFGLPLAVGMTSEGEYADFELTQETDPEHFMVKLNQFLPEPIRVTAAATKNSKVNIMASIGGADYILEIYLNEELSVDEVKKRIVRLLEEESIKVMKEGKAKDAKGKGSKGKGGAGKDGNGKDGAGKGGNGSSDTLKEMEIRPLILDVKVGALQNVPAGYESFQSAFIINARFSAGSAANLRPELFIRALAEQAQIPVETGRMHRKELYVVINGRMANPLDQAVLS